MLGGNALPFASDNERCGQVTKEFISSKLKISLPNEVIAAANRIGKKENDKARGNWKIPVRSKNKQQNTI